MKRLHILLSFATAFSVCLAPRLTIAATTKHLDVALRRQERDNWCWAASIQMIAHFYGKHFVEQCEIVELTRSMRDGMGSEPCCIDPDKGCNKSNGLETSPFTTASKGSIPRILASLGVHADDYSDLLPWYSTWKAQIDDGHPVLFRWSNPGHASVVAGYHKDGSVEELWVLNPWTKDGETWMDFEEFIDPSGDREVTHMLITEPDPDGSRAVLFEDESYKGDRLTSARLGTALSGWGWDNRVSSAEIIGAPYILYEGDDYTSYGWGVPPGLYPRASSWGGADNALSSGRKVPGLSEKHAVVLFDRAYYQGDWKLVTDSDPLLSSSGWRDRVSSLIVIRGIYHLYDNDNFNGRPYAVSSTGGPNHDGFYRDWASWGGPDDDARSIEYVSLNPANSTGLMLYEDADFKGRAVYMGTINTPAAWLNDFAKIDFDNQVTAIQTFGGVWDIYDGANQTGTRTRLKAMAWYHNSTASGIGNDKKSSLKFVKEGWAY